MNMHAQRLEPEPAPTYFLGCNCYSCRTFTSLENLALKPSADWWLRIVRVFRGQCFMLSYAEKKHYPFDRLECEACFGPGYDPSRRLGVDPERPGTFLSATRLGA